LKINGLSIISHVFKKAEKANIGEVVVATEDQEIVDDVIQNGGNAILTHNQHKTGTDRVYEALQKIDASKVDLIMNLQGDEPLMNINDIINLNNKMKENNSELGTLASNITDIKLYQNQNVVKVITKDSLDNLNFSEAINFERKILNDRKNIYHHLGIYCFKKEVLEKFTSLNQSSNELKYNLEQLRALDNNMKIRVALAESSPIGVDTEEDFMAIKKIMEYKS
jgi:3-deoxy-manno-octulosonate cytidylyltransferase (CMP-KDO synthetase)